MMPPSGSAEFEVHLERSVQGLSQLRSGASTDVFLVHCPQNLPANDKETDQKVNPLDIVEELKNDGYKWSVNIYS